MISMTVFWPDCLRRSPQVGVRAAASWPELLAWISRPIVAASKSASGGYSFATFRGDVRRLDCVEQVTALVLDIDRGDARVDHVAEVLAKYRVIAYATFSSTPAHPRCRALVALPRAVSATEYPLLWEHARAHLAAAGVEVDRTARDSSRLWYVPVIGPSTAWELAHHDGAPIDVDVALARAAEHDARIERELRERAAHTLGATTPAIHRVRKYLDAVPGAVSGARGHDATFRVACILAASVADPAVQEALLAEFNARCSPPWSAKELAHALDSARRADLKPLPDRRLS